MLDTDLIWLAGWLEGEGCFMPGPPSRPHSPRVVAVTTDHDVAKHVGTLLGRQPLLVKRRNPRHSDRYDITICGKPAVELMQELRPLMRSRRQAAIDKALASYEVKPNRGTRRPSLTEDEAVFVHKQLSAGMKPAEILPAFRATFKPRTITRDVIRSVRRGYRAYGLAPVPLP